MQFDVEIQGRMRHVQVHREGQRFVLSLDGREQSIDLARLDAQVLSLLLGHSSHEVVVSSVATGGVTVTVDGVAVQASVNSRRRWGKTDAAATASGPQRVIAPMPGKVVRVLVAPGDVVEARQPLVVIEAMKMENELRAVRSGTVAEVPAREGQSVDAGALLLVVSSA